MFTVAALSCLLAYFLSFFFTLYIFTILPFFLHSFLHREYYSRPTPSPPSPSPPPISAISDAGLPLFEILSNLPADTASCFTLLSPDLFSNTVSGAADKHINVDVYMFICLYLEKGRYQYIGHVRC